MKPDADPPPLVRTERGRRTLAFAPDDIQSELVLARPDTLALDYTRAMMAFVLFVPHPRRIVMVGLGGGSLARFCRKHFPQAHITVVEVRADVIALRDQFLVPPDDARFQVVHADAARWLAERTEAEPADVLLLDGFDAAGLPPALTGNAFYADCRRALRPGGVLVVNVFTYDDRHDAVLAALDERFAGRLCWLEGAAGNNRIVFAVASGGQAPGRTARWLLRRRKTGWGWLNRIAMRALVRCIAARSVLSTPHPPEDATQQQ